MEPPPAPMDSTATIGWRTGRPEVERLENPSFVVDPFAHLETELGRHVGRHLRRKIEAIEVAPVLASDLQGVAEAARCDQGDLCKIVLDDGIGDEGRSVDEVVHVRPVEADRLQGREQALHAVAGAGRDLCGSCFAARASHCDHVRERAANVDTDFPPVWHGVVSERVSDYRNFTLKFRKWSSRRAAEVNPEADVGGCESGGVFEPPGDARGGCDPPRGARLWLRRKLSPFISRI